MPQHDFDISTADANTGSTMRAAINAALQALAGQSSGTTEPATTYPYQLWADTTSGYLKIRNAANSAWITLMLLTAAGIWHDGNCTKSLGASGWQKLASGLIIQWGTGQAAPSTSFSVTLPSAFTTTVYVVALASPGDGTSLANGACVASADAASSFNVRVAQPGYGYRWVAIGY
jgi:hypothetical protein